MIEVFHGSTMIVDKPQILPPTRTLDYGAGLYTTTSHEQAADWVRRKLSALTPLGYINRYEVNIDKIRAKLKTLWWISFCSTPSVR